MNRALIPPELEAPSERAVLLAYLAVIADRVRILDAYRKAGAESMSMLDLAILQIVSTFEIVEGNGSRPQDVVSAVHAPRRTVRDGLKRMVEAGVLMRDDDGYHPTDLTIRVFLEEWPAHCRELERMAALVVNNLSSKPNPGV